MGLAFLLLCRFFSSFPYHTFWNLGKLSLCDFPLCALLPSHLCLLSYFCCFVEDLSLVERSVEWRNSRIPDIFTSNDYMVASFEGYHSLDFCACFNGSLLFSNSFSGDSRTDMYTCVSFPSFCPAKSIKLPVRSRSHLDGRRPIGIIVLEPYHSYCEAWTRPDTLSSIALSSNPKREKSSQYVAFPLLCASGVPERNLSFFFPFRHRQLTARALCPCCEQSGRFPLDSLVSRN